MAKEFFTEEYYKENMVSKPTRKNFRDLTNTTINKITVLDYAGTDGKHSHWWCKCYCDDSRFFKVNASSLMRGVTGSCGCNYKNNRFTKESSKLEDAGTKLGEHLTFTKFSGWNYPCSINCSLCGKETYFEKANNSRGYTCCIKITRNTIDQNLKEYGYDYIGDSKGVCDGCGSIKATHNINSYCPCKYNGVGGEKYSAVYILQDTSNTYLKIGKSCDPNTRYRDISKSVDRQYGEDLTFELKEVLWTYSDKIAYWLESRLHQEFKEYRLKDTFNFDGSTEVFELSLDRVLHWIDENEELLENLKDDNYTPPPQQTVKEPSLPELYIERSFEVRGMWFPSKSYYCKYYNISLDSFEESLKFSNMNWYKKWKVLKQEYESEVNGLYTKDWGDGYKGTIHGLGRKYYIDDGTLWHRINVLKLSMKDALELPNGNMFNYWKINGKYYNKRELCNILGIKQHTITQRINRGIPFNYAITTERYKSGQYKDSIFILNGDAFWWADLAYIFGEVRSISKIIHDYTTVYNWLIQDQLISEQDNFEEVSFR